MKKIPALLKKGDYVAFVSPSGYLEKGELDFAKELILKWGFNVIIGNNVYEKDGIFAGNDEQRAFDLNNALLNKKVKAIFCTRGGYGAVRTIQKLDWNLFESNPKWIIGYSDITVFHSLCNKYKIPSIHGLMPRNFVKADEKTKEEMRNLLEGRLPVYSELKHYLNRDGSTKAEIVGGNLSILLSLAGSNLDLQTKGKILFIEDVGEKLYHLDRMMQNLKISGKLEKLKGLIVGTFTEIQDGKTPFGKSAEEIIFDVVKEYNYPLIFGFQSGHIPNCKALIFGMKAQMKVKKGVGLINYLTA